MNYFKLLRIVIAAFLLAILAISGCSALNSVKDTSGIPVVALYFWAQGEQIAKSAHDWFAGIFIISTVVGVISSLLFTVEGYKWEERQNLALKLWVKAAWAASATFFILLILAKSFPTTETINFIYGRMQKPAVIEHK